MPLIPQQDIVYGFGQFPKNAQEDLMKKLDAYPPVRIVSLTCVSQEKDTCWLMAVVETI